MHADKEMTIKEIVAAVRGLARTVHADASVAGREFGLTGSQSQLLRTLLRDDLLSSSELGRRMYVTPSNVTGIIDRLESKGLVVRGSKAGDRRVSLISLTEEGRKVAAGLPDPVELKLLAGLADMPPDKIAQLHEAVVSLLDILEIKVDHE